MNNPVNEAWALLEELTPLTTDCGTVCGGRCCQPSDQRVGMRLFPGEDALLPDGRFTLTVTADGGTLLSCDGRCDRACRPLACRMFPLFPYVCANGRVKAVYDPRAFSVCPLVRECAHVPLDRHFVRAVRRVGRLLMRDPACRAYLMDQSREIDALWRLLPLNEQRPPIARRKP